MKLSRRRSNSQTWGLKVHVRSYLLAKYPQCRKDKCKLLRAMAARPWVKIVNSCPNALANYFLYIADKIVLVLTDRRFSCGLFLSVVWLVMEKTVVLLQNFVNFKGSSVYWVWPGPYSTWPWFTPRSFSFSKNQFIIGGGDFGTSRHCEVKVMWPRVTLVAEIMSPTSWIDWGKT